MSELIIWHNPRCSKSRAALELLTARGLEPTIVRYLDAPPSRTEIERVLGLLGVPPAGLLRTSEAVYRELGLEAADDRARIEAMATHPILIERPLVIRGQRAVIGRPPERVLELL